MHANHGAGQGQDLWLDRVIIMVPATVWMRPCPMHRVQDSSEGNRSPADGSSAMETPGLAADAHGCCWLSSGLVVTAVTLQGSEALPPTLLSWQSP